MAPLELGYEGWTLYEILGVEGRRLEWVHSHVVISQVYSVQQAHLIYDMLGTEGDILSNSSGNIIEIVRNTKLQSLLQVRNFGDEIQLGWHWMFRLKKVTNWSRFWQLQQCDNPSALQVAVRMSLKTEGCIPGDEHVVYKLFVWFLQLWLCRKSGLFYWI